MVYKMDRHACLFFSVALAEFEYLLVQHSYTDFGVSRKALLRLEIYQ